MSGSRDPVAADNPRARFLGRLPADPISRYHDGSLALIVRSICNETFGIILIESFRNVARYIEMLCRTAAAKGAHDLAPRLERVQ